MGNFIFDALKKISKKEEKETLSKDLKATKFFKDVIEADTKKQISILSDSNICEKLTELELNKKGLATDNDEFTKLYLKHMKTIEKNRGKCEKMLEKALDGDFSMLENLVAGPVPNATIDKKEDKDSTFEKKDGVDDKKYESGRKIVSEVKKDEVIKEASLNKEALKESPWTITKDEAGKDIIVANADKDAFISTESKAKLQKKSNLEEPKIEEINKETNVWKCSFLLPTFENVKFADVKTQTLFATATFAWEVVNKKKGNFTAVEAQELKSSLSIIKAGLEVCENEEEFNNVLAMLYDLGDKFKVEIK